MGHKSGEGGILMTDKLMEQTNNYLEEYGVAKGYSVRELRQKKVTTIPDNMKDRYKTFEEYSDAIHDFLNGL